MSNSENKHRVSTVEDVRRNSYLWVWLIRNSACRRLNLSCIKFWKRKSLKYQVVLKYFVWPVENFKGKCNSFLSHGPHHSLLPHTLPLLTLVSPVWAWKHLGLWTLRKESVMEAEIDRSPSPPLDCEVHQGMDAESQTLCLSYSLRISSPCHNAWCKISAG